MILHIFTNSTYTHKFIRFIEECFDESEHQFIIFCSNKNSKFIDFYESRNNCKVTYSKNIYFNYNYDFKKSKKIVIHQLNQPVLMASLYFFYNSSYKKMIWSIWGGDVYFYKYKSNSFKDNIFEILRKITIPKIPLITSYIKGDYDKVCEVYNSKAKYIKSKYPSPIDFEKIINIDVNNIKESNSVSILVGNSGDDSNEHIATFELLKKYKYKDIKIFSVLSYGGSKEYIESVIEKGRDIFKEKFEPICNYMSFEEYLGFINSIDICVFNHKRQQGLGSLFVFFSLNKKVFINSLTTPFNYYEDLGVDVYSTDKIESQSFKEFINQSLECKNRTRELMLHDIDERTIQKEWQNVFSYKSIE